MEFELLEVNPTTRWTLTNKKLNAVINANDIFDISCCCVYGQLKSINFPSTLESKSENEYLKLMEKEGFTISCNTL